MSNIFCRFRSAKETENLETQAKAKGEELPETERFDSNCITPGTAFMVRLQEALKEFVNAKMTSKMWQGCRIILSGHETPGEGEHKIMEYIRYLQAQPGFDPNTRHCLYGLDADLVMLGLCTHELRFSLLREEVSISENGVEYICACNFTSQTYTVFFRLNLETKVRNMHRSTMFYFSCCIWVFYGSTLNLNLTVLKKYCRFRMTLKT